MVESLTATERRIVELAAVGKTNSEIGRDLYVTTRPVEWHLAHVYRKLRFANRRQLAAAMLTSTSPTS